jgi:phosphonatase-like hydrolase
MFKLAVFDVAGTVVADNGTVITAFEEAFSEVVPDLWRVQQAEFIHYAKETMGQSKIEVFAHLLNDPELAAQAADAFQASYLMRIGEATPFDGVEQMFISLRENGIAVALNTGFNRATLDTLIRNLGWQDLIDASATQTETASGRPSPAMLEFVSRKLGIKNPEEVAVFGDTASDIEAGIRFGAGLKVGVLTGSHQEHALREAGADLVVRDATQAFTNLLD